MGSPLVFHEAYGDLSRAQLAAYRTYNVSPADHDELVSVYGAENHDLITSAVKQFTHNGSYQAYLWWQSRSAE